jgi:hypothetical protein
MQGWFLVDHYIAPEAYKVQDVLALGTFTANQDVPRFGAYTSDISVSRIIALRERSMRW